MKYTQHIFLLNQNFPGIIFNLKFIRKLAEYVVPEFGMLRQEDVEIKVN